MKWGREVSGHLVDVVETDPKEIFHPDLAKTFKKVPDHVVDGAKLIDGVWINPEIDLT